MQRSKERLTERPMYISTEMLMGMVFIHRYRFLTIPQFARVSCLSLPYAREVLLRLHYRGDLGYIGNFPLRNGLRAPKVYFLRRSGFELLITESGVSPSDLGEFRDLKRELAWTPQTQHRLDLLDSLISLECAVRSLPHLHLVRTFLEYRRVKGTRLRETSDYVSLPNTSENRIVPDAAFVLENRQTGRRGLFFLEQDTGSERIAPTQGSRNARSTLHTKFIQYDKYLTGGRFAETYKEHGDFRFATVLLVTNGEARVENIRKAATLFPSSLHRYYRLTTSARVMQDFLGPIWKSRDPQDGAAHALIAQ